MKEGTRFKGTPSATGAETEVNARQPLWGVVRSMEELQLYEPILSRNHEGDE